MCPVSPASGLMRRSYFLPLMMTWVGRQTRDYARAVIETIAARERLARVTGRRTGRSLADELDEIALRCRCSMSDPRTTSSATTRPGCRSRTTASGADGPGHLRLVVEARRGEPAGRELDPQLHRASVETVSVTADHVEIARQAWRRYGKGRHPAGLNVGDCFAYTLACSSGEVLLYVGSFVRTDVPRAE
jgi:uncharacterized protein with PIN domain